MMYPGWREGSLQSLTRNWHAEGVKDPTYDALVGDLQRLRSKPGLPTIQRLDGAFALIDDLGQGDLARAWHELAMLQSEHGSDSTTDIGAYFYLAGWGIGRDTLEQRREQYASSHHCDSRTGLRRADRGMRQLATLIRHRSVTNRPWVFASLLQSGNYADAIIRFHMTREAWRPPTIRINDEPAPYEFVLHKQTDRPGWLHSLAIYEHLPLDLQAPRSHDMLSVFVHWAMPIWPTWFHVTFAADPRILTTSHSYHDRGLALGLQWSHRTTAEDCGDLVKDHRIWTPEADPHRFELPEGWGR